MVNSLVINEVYVKDYFRGWRDSTRLALALKALGLIPGSLCPQEVISESRVKNMSSEMQGVA